MTSRCNLLMAKFASMEIELTATWHSSGYFSLSHPQTEKVVSGFRPFVLNRVDLNFTIESLQKSIELYDSAPDREYMTTFEPYYSLVQPDTGMLNFGPNMISAYKVEGGWIHLEDRSSTCAIPGSISMLTLKIDELKELWKEISEFPIFYSGCQFS